MSHTKNRPTKRSKLSPPETEDVETVKIIESSNLCYDVVPEAGRGDIFTQKSDDSFELFLLYCAGCSTEFRVDTPELLRRYVRHCIEDCVPYQQLGTIRHCDGCLCLCIDDAALIRHRTTSTGACAFSPRKEYRPTGEPVPSSSHEPDVITISDQQSSQPDAGRIENICYEYVPDVSAGDAVDWKEGQHVDESAVCKGCTLRFPTLTSSERTNFVNHCLTECDAYRLLNISQLCYPCRLLCMDRNAFIEHILNSEDCPAHPYLKIKNKTRNGCKSDKPGSKNNTRGSQPDTIVLE